MVWKSRFDMLSHRAPTGRKKGMANSAGVMVNYKYNLEEIVSNHEGYVDQGVIPLSPSVLSLL